MKRILSAICVVAILVGMLPMTVLAAGAETGKTSYHTLQDAVDSNVSETIVLTEDTADLVVSKDATIDLNGHNIAGVTVTGGTLYVKDSKTDDYTVADGVYGKLTNVSGNVVALDGYVKLAEDEGISFHRVDLGLESMTLRPARVGVYYTSAFSGDEVVAEAVESYGVALCIVEAPNAENMDTYSQYSVRRNFKAGKNANAADGTLLHSIMTESNTDERNAANAATQVYGRAYIKTADGYVFGEAVSRDLQSLVEAIDAVWSTLNEKQQTAALDMYKTYKSVMSAWNIPNMTLALMAGGTEIRIPVQSENGVVTEEITVEQDGVVITIPMGALLEAGADKLTLTVTKKNTSDSGVEVGENEELVPIDVHVAGLSAENTAPLTVELGKVMPENLNMGNYHIYHVEANGTNEMSLVANDAEFTAHNQYKYTLDGELTLHMATFSEVAVVADTENAWNGTRNYEWYDANATQLYIRNADQLAGFGAIVGDMAKTADKVEIAQDSFKNKTVTLLADICIGDLNSENGIVFYPVGYWNDEGTYEKSQKAISSGFYAFEGTFDGNNNTISDFYQNTWEMKGDHNWYAPEDQHYRDGMGLFGKVYGGTVKNLIVDNFSCDSEIGTTGTIAAYADCGATFENISIFNCNPRVYNIGNGGIVGCVGWYAKEATEKQVTFKNITVDNTNKISALWGTYDAACGGVVGQYYPTSGQSDTIKNAGVHFDNCHVSAQLDVFNDVCGNYQYYAYRYTGMLVGSVRENETINGHVYPKMDGITAENCTVHFGTWNDYYYCELVANSLASYTHDHQFSRLDQIQNISEIQDGSGNWTKTGNFIVMNGKDPTDICVHIMKDAEGNLYRHSHEDSGEETVNGQTVLKEDNQRIYLPFNNLVTGYGWGVTTKAVGDMPGVTILDRVVADSVVKFEKVETAEDTYITGTEITIGDLFQAAEKIDAAIAINSANVQVSVSPADDSSSASGVFAANTADWTEGTITLSGVGNAKITITDHNFCTPTTVEVFVKGVAAIDGIEYESLQDAFDAVEDGQIITLQDDIVVEKYLDIKTANGGEIERNITLDLNGKTIAPAEEGYNYRSGYPLVFVGVNQTVNITGGKITCDKGVTLGGYGVMNLDDVAVENTGTTADDMAVCVWNWNEGDHYWDHYQYLVTASATISGGSIEGGILVEGTVEFVSDGEFDKLYLNNTTARGKLILPKGYGMVNMGTYYTNLHAHTYENEVCTVTGCGAVEVTYTYVEKSLTEIKSTDIVVITMTTADGTVYALTNGNGTKNNPAATEVVVTGSEATRVIGTINGEVADNLKWNIVNNDGVLTIYPNGKTNIWLYSLASGTDVRVGTNANNTFKLVENGYLYNTVTERYLGVNTDNKDWRCYKDSKDAVALTFYVAKAECNHTNVVERAAIAATCTEAGHKAGTYCIDCDTYTNGGEMTNANGHTWGEFKTVKEATCTVDGQEAANCTVCNKRTTKTIKAAHTADESKTVVTAPTCEDAGYTTYTCAVCEEIYTGNETEALGHTWVDATCTDAKICSVCKTIEGEALGHKYESVVTAPTCEAEGYTTHTCSVCGGSYKDSYVDALGHKYVGVETKAPTCTDKGVMTYTCQNDASHTYTEEIAAKGHNYSYVTVTPTCTVAGYTTYTCACGDTYTEAGEDAKGHTYKCGTCTVCKDQQVPEVRFELGENVETTEHKDNNTSKTTYTETTNGYTLDITDGVKMYPGSNDAKGNGCIKLGTSDDVGGFKFVAPDDVTEVVIYVAQYKANATKITVNGVTYTIETASNNGEYTAITVDTSEIKTVTVTTVSGGVRAMINAIVFKVSVEHGETTSTTVDANCTKAGSITVTCDDCDKVISTKEIPATGHAYSEKVTTAAGCETTGAKTLTCANCKDTKTEVIPATGHNYVDGKCSFCEEDDPNYVPEESTEATEPVTSWVKTDLADIKATDVVVITMTKGNNTWALTSANGSSSSPTVVSVAVNGDKLTGEIDGNIQWNITNVDGNLTIKPNGETTALYCTSSNTGVRVGTNNNKVFTITSGYLKNTATGRYIGVYNAQDWRCYTSINSNITGQTLAFYVLTNGSSSGGDETPECQHNWVAATCQTPKTCSVCGVTEGEVVNHNVVDGKCTTEGCDYTESAGGKEQNVEMSIFGSQGTKASDNSSISWSSGDVTFTNYKTTSSSAIVNTDATYYRVYAKSMVTISANGGKISKIVITCTSSNYTTAMVNSCKTVDGATVESSGYVVTVTFATPIDSFTIDSMTAQSRLSKIEVTYTK